MKQELLFVDIHYYWANVGSSHLFVSISLIPDTKYVPSFCQINCPTSIWVCPKSKLCLIGKFVPYMTQYFCSVIQRLLPFMPCTNRGSSSPDGLLYFTFIPLWLTRKEFLLSLANWKQLERILYLAANVMLSVGILCNEVLVVAEPRKGFALLPKTFLIHNLGKNYKLVNIKNLQISNRKTYLILLPFWIFLSWTHWSELEQQISSH